MSIRRGPNGETQLTPIPIETRGFGELPRKTSLKPGVGVYDEAPPAGATPVAELMLQSAFELLNGE